MASKSPFLNWLNAHECKPGPVNSYYYALFSEKLRSILSPSNTSSNLRNCFGNNPDFDFLEELEKEKKGNGESPILRDLLINLLNLACPDKDVRINNFMDELRGFVTSLYTGKIKQKKLLPNKPFHEYPAEMKLWIFCALIQYNTEAVDSVGEERFPRNHPIPIGRDSMGNLYFIANDSLLYVQYGSKMQEMTRAEENFMLATLESTLIAMPRWKLLADSEGQWKQIAMILDGFNEDQISERIEAALQRAHSRSIGVEHEQEFCEKEEDEDAGQFERVPARRSRTQLKKPPSVDPYEEEHYSQSHSKNSTDHRRHVENHSPDFPPQDHQGQRAKTVRCMYFPHCRRSDEECFFVHPRIPCKNFKTGKCPGIYCRFLHPNCTEDGHCTDINCPFEHKVTIPSIRRVQYSKMKEDSQSSESTRDEEESKRYGTPGTQHTSSRTRVAFEENSHSSSRPIHRNREPSPPRRVMQPEKNPVSPVHNERPFSNKELRCHYFPRCNKPADKCFYAHPRDKCSTFPNCVRGRDCPFLHGPCTKDGICAQEYCPYEHYQQIPPRASIAYQRHLQAKNQRD